MVGCRSSGLVVVVKHLPPFARLSGSDIAVGGTIGASVQPTGWSFRYLAVASGRHSSLRLRVDLDPRLGIGPDNGTLVLPCQATSGRIASPSARTPRNTLRSEAGPAESTGWALAFYSVMTRPAGPTIAGEADLAAAAMAQADHRDGAGDGIRTRRCGPSGSLADREGSLLRPQ